MKNHGKKSLKKLYFFRLKKKMPSKMKIAPLKSLAKPFQILCNVEMNNFFCIETF